MTGWESEETASVVDSDNDAHSVVLFPRPVFYDIMVELCSAGTYL